MFLAIISARKALDRSKGGIADPLPSEYLI